MVEALSIVFPVIGVNVVVTPHRRLLPPANDECGGLELILLSLLDDVVLDDDDGSDNNRAPLLQRDAGENATAVKTALEMRTR